MNQKKNLDGSESEGSIRGSTEELEGDQWTPVTFKRPPWRYPPHLGHLSENWLDSESIQVLYHHVRNPKQGSNCEVVQPLLITVRDTIHPNVEIAGAR